MFRALKTLLLERNRLLAQIHWELFLCHSNIHCGTRGGSEEGKLQCILLKVKDRKFIICLKANLETNCFIDNMKYAGWVQLDPVATSVNRERSKVNISGDYMFVEGQHWST